MFITNIHEPKLAQSQEAILFKSNNVPNNYIIATSSIELSKCPLLSQVNNPVLSQMNTKYLNYFTLKQHQGAHINTIR